MMKKIVMVVSIFFIFIGLCFYIVFYSTFFPGICLSQWLQRKYPEIHLESFQYKKRSFEFLNQIEFSDVHVVLKKDNLHFKIDFAGLKLIGHKSFWHPENIFDLSVLELDIKSSVFEMTRGRLKLKFALSKNHSMNLQGDLNVGNGSLGPYALEDISAGISGDERHLRLDQFAAVCFKGKLAGDILLRLSSVVSYELKLTFSEMRTEDLRSLNDQIFSQLNGNLNGTIQIEGTDDQIETLVSDLNVQQGGKIRSSLFGLLVDYLPEGSQKAVLSDLIQSDQNVLVKKAVLQIKNLGVKKFPTRMILESDKVNLDLSLDINLDAPINQWIQKMNELKKENL